MSDTSTTSENPEQLEPDSVAVAEERVFVAVANLVSALKHESAVPVGGKYCDGLTERPLGSQERSYNCLECVELVGVLEDALVGLSGAVRNG